MQEYLASEKGKREHARKTTLNGKQQRKKTNIEHEYDFTNEMNG